jgi:hypothetical protein
MKNIGECLVLGKPYRIDEAVLCPIFRIPKKEALKEQIICMAEDWDFEADFLEKQKRPGCPNYLDVCYDVASRQDDWDNFICSDECPYKQKSEPVRPEVNYNGSGWGDELIYNEEPEFF